MRWTSSPVRKRADSPYVRYRQRVTILGTVRLAVLLTLLFLASGIAQAQELVGQRLKITGRWTEDHLKATRVRQQKPKRDRRRGRVIGRIDDIDTTARTLRIGPILVEWNNATRIEGISLEDLAPDRAIKVKGRLLGPAHLLATSIKAASSAPDYLQIRGTVTEGERRPDGSLQLIVLGVRLEISNRVYTRASALTRRPDDRRPEDQLTVPLLGRPLAIGGEIGTTWRYRGDFKLADTAKDDVARLDQKLQLELFYALTPDVSLFLEGKSSYEVELHTEADDRELEWAVERGETWLYIGNILRSDFSLQIGRQNFTEDREWWWNEDLDALRIHYDRRHLHAELGLAQETAVVSTEEDRIDPEAVNVVRLLGHAAWSWAKDQRLAGFFLYQNDHSSRQSIGQLVREEREDPSDADILWLGARASGELDLDRFGELDYWVDSASVVGEEILLNFNKAEGGLRRVSSRIKRDVIGWAFDGGLTWETPIAGRPTLTLGYALGSGDRKPDRGTDRAFRQTGLHDNNDRFRGVDSFRYYGELLRPGLSNLHIWTAAVGFRFWRSSSLELVYHLYCQVHPAPFLRDARIGTDPEGNRQAIGQEWDLVVGLEEWKHVEIELVGALFRAGSAYGPLSGETAFNVILKIDYNF